MSEMHSLWRTVEGPMIPDPVTWAAISVDVMKTFMPGGGLGVNGGHEIVIPGLHMIRKFAPDRRYALRDIHAPGSISLCSSFIGYKPYDKLRYREVKHWTEQNHRMAPHCLLSLEELKKELKKLKGRFQILWPDHGIEGTDESRVESQIEMESTMTWYKGNRPHVDSNSGFQENDGKSTGLDLQLKCRHVKVLVVWGIAGDVCSGLTALHAKQRGFDVYFVMDLSPCISPEGRDGMYKQLIAAGVQLITSDQIQLAA